MTRPYARLLPALLLVSGTGCDTVTAGNQGTLEFEFVSSDRLIPVSFGTPLAAGFKVEVNVFVVGGTRVPAKISLAQPADQTIARVPASTDHSFTLEGRRAGTTSVDVVSAAGNDSFDLAVNDLAKVNLLYPSAVLVPASPPVSVAQGGSAHFPFTLLDSDARQLIGYGALPVDIAPTTAAHTAASDSAGLLTVAFSDLGAVTLTPLGANALDVTVVPVSDITALSFTATDTSAAAIDVGKVTTVVVDGRNEANERILGLTGLVTVSTSTPAVCSVAQSVVLGDAVYQVTGLTAGSCAIAAALGALTATTSVEVR